jgi:chemotaxis protein histidine kinase CheA
MCRARVPLMVPPCPPWPFPQERLLQLDTKLKAQLGRSDQARGRAARVDASIVEIRIGTERLVEMLSHVPLSKTVTHAPPALSCTRKGGGAADGEEEDEGQEPDGTPDGTPTIGPPGSGEPPSTAPGAQTIVSLALHPRCVLPKGSAAEAAVSALADLRQLASVEDTMAFGASRSLGAAVAALHNLAAIEHRLVTTVLPEIQRSDARSRMKQGHFKQRRVERLHRLSDAAAAVTVTNLMANLADQISHDLQKFDDSFKLEGAPAAQTSSFFFITQATEAAAAAAETAAAEAAAAETAAAEAAAAEAAAAEAAAAEKAAAEAAEAEAAEAEAVAKAPPPATPIMRPSSAGPSAAGASTSTFMVPPRRPSSAMSKLGSIRSGGAKSKVRAVGALAALACIR